MDAGTRESLRIVEHFVSPQGEGILVGVHSTFLRVSGCNLRCSWCDTPESSWAPKGERLPLSRLLEICHAGPRHVVITGGEPLIFPQVLPLTAELRAAGHHVTIETAAPAGSVTVPCDLVSISPKLSHSTPWARAPAFAPIHDRRRLHVDRLVALMRASPWQLKFVVRSQREQEMRADLGEIDALLLQLDLPAAQHPTERILLMPEATDREALRRGYKALVEPCRYRGLRLGLRLHIELFGHRPGT